MIRRTLCAVIFASAIAFSAGPLLTETTAPSENPTTAVPTASTTRNATAITDGGHCDTHGQTLTMNPDGTVTGTPETTAPNELCSR